MNLSLTIDRLSLAWATVTFWLANFHVITLPSANTVLGKIKQAKSSHSPSSTVIKARAERIIHRSAQPPNRF